MNNPTGGQKKGSRWLPLAVRMGCYEELDSGADDELVPDEVFELDDVSVDAVLESLVDSLGLLPLPLALAVP